MSWPSGGFSSARQGFDPVAELVEHRDLLFAVHPQDELLELAHGQKREAEAMLALEVRAIRAQMKHLELLAVKPPEFRDSERPINRHARNRPARDVNLD